MQKLQETIFSLTFIQKHDSNLENITVTYQFGKQCFQFGILRNSFSCWTKLKECSFFFNTVFFFFCLIIKSPKIRQQELKLYSQMRRLTSAVCPYSVFFWQESAGRALGSASSKKRSHAECGICLYLYSSR